MPDAQAPGNDRQNGQREGSGLWGILQVRNEPQYSCAAKLIGACVIASLAGMGGRAIWCARDYEILSEASQSFLLFAAGKLLGGLKPQQESSSDGVPTVREPQVGPDGQITPQPIENAVLAWPFGSKLSMHVYLSTDPEGDVFGHNNLLPSFVWNDITFGDWNEARVIDLDVNFPQVCPYTTGDIEMH